MQRTEKFRCHRMELPTRNPRQPTKTQQDAVLARPKNGGLRPKGQSPDSSALRPEPSGLFSRRIISPAMPRMAAADPADAFPRADNRPVLSHRPDEIAAATRLKSALPAEKRTERPLVNADQDNQHKRQPVRGARPLQRARLVSGRQRT